MQVNVKFTAAEYEAVFGRAAQARLTVPSYLALTGLRPEGVAASEARAALINAMAAQRVLAGIGSNLNQLTRKLHGTGEVDASLGDVAREVGRVAATVEGAVSAVARVVTGGRRRTPTARGDTRPEGPKTPGGSATPPTQASGQATG